MTVGNMPRTDIVAQHMSHHAVIAVQCKTSAPGGPNVQLGASAQSFAAAGSDEWFVCVSLRALDERPVFYIVPRDHLVAHVWVAHHFWLSQPKRDGSQRKNSTMRVIKLRDLDGYREAWELLDLPAAEAPVRLPEAFYERRTEVGPLPEHFPLDLRPSEPPDRG